MMEELYDLHPEVIDGKTILTIDNKFNSSIRRDLDTWAEYYQKYINNEISEEEYREFKYQCPEAVAFNTKQKK